MCTSKCCCNSVGPALVFRISIHVVFDYRTSWLKGRLSQTSSKASSPVVYWRSSRFRLSRTPMSRR
jgi:hypothetical protein